MSDSDSTPNDQDQASQTHPPRGDSSRSRPGLILCLQWLLIVGSVLHLLLATWGRWGDALVDYGLQVYLAWRVSEGEVLYRDLAYYNGPLSVYLNAGLFRVFGTSIWLLHLTNLALLIALLATLFLMLRYISSRWAAVAACLAFLWLFAFARYTGINNYNYVAPYTHELTHGLLLSLWSLACLWQAPRFGWKAALPGGLFLGLAFLTKFEISLPVCGAALAALLLGTWRARPLMSRKAVWAAFLVGCLLPPAAAFSLLATQMPVDQAALGTSGSWAVIFNPDVRQLKFFQNILGTATFDQRAVPLVAIAAASAVGLAVMAVAVRATHSLPVRVRMAGMIGLGLLLVAVLWPASFWPIAILPLPLWTLGLAAMQLVRYGRAEPGSEAQQAAARATSLLVLAGLLLGKIALHSQVQHYGFVHAMLATLLLVVALVDWLPAALLKSPLERNLLRVPILLVLAVWVMKMHAMHNEISQGPYLEIATGNDALLDNTERQFSLAETVQFLRAHTRDKDTVAVFPEGVMLNYLARRQASSKFTNFMPAEGEFFGRRIMFDALRSSRPDWIVVVPKDMSDWDMDRVDRLWEDAYQWMEAEYEPAYKATGPRGEFPILVLRRSRRLLP